MSERTFTAEELLQYNGTDPSKPVYLALRGTVFDVTAGKDFYGPGGPYEVFAGRECARALALMKIEVSECNADLEGLDEKQLTTLQQWHTKFSSKYTVVGKLGTQRGGGAPPSAPKVDATPFPTGLAINTTLLVILTLVGIYVLFFIQEKGGARQEL